jgi:hypothetical protein
MIISKEYESAFPYEQEYNAWIDSIERDYVDEVKYRAKLVITNRDRVFLDEFSPFNTVNS